ALADRWDKRRILMLTQSTMAALALVLGSLAAAGAVRLWMVYLLALLLGCATALDNPARQSFMSELVGPGDLPNAVALNSASFNLARIIGPSLAGIVIAAWGIAPAFLLNAASFGAVLTALAALDRDAIVRQRPRPGARGGVVEGLRYAWSTEELRAPLLLMAAVATLGINFRVVLPVLARFAFGGGPRDYGFLASLFAAGSLLGALATASRAEPSYRLMIGAAAAFGALALAAAAAPTLVWEGAALLPLGAASITFLSTSNALLQTRCAPEMRGRIMSLYAVLFLGSTPFGGGLVGWLSEVWGPRAGLYLAAASGLGGAALASWHRLPRKAARPAPAGEGPADRLS
ncbi:MAG: MFS transporter, partial [Deltaproteobacteria bacterium]|nr:MFS transporter [Deltaproteobacteria bacterium]